ncbi:MULTISPECIES: HypC/HybG/HupF family hydrogenase formation chaperone [Archaeoglobus]|jgi:hydrogenase expression/formation protein HypC|uniref:Hydrogenase expression/formation protein (HypC) n=3 Tax=Archaeoglobus fulgidus TaxID=2234 RepID=O28902_ARCFU|nr:MULTISPECIES: HypC/HybG/HupF family hydrogenase formation chaperone [Archaeoglobus]AAB89878.1 hydrogenase expression/formation protein (hypC) [Archaeoglobus fulgidus DSM 4304]AIG98248.1 hydrogenase assembly chaperone HypC/HupF [Archaeoglobus fulgidus DSM 8774]KUJ93176.1 MAG: Hydrogenase expression/formation protein (HypC) [Archaeoglobus fulgidus]KUK05797.1 MAG: Hydrogenase expression/formation protein (HypC) [Archaeoglobus fulgidus]MDI3498588.1 hydrogenase expression/formation protein HypC 
MCIAIPGRIERIDYPIAIVDFKGLKKEVRIDLLENPQIGDYVLVHVGMAIQKVDEEEAKKTWELLERVADETGNQAF